MLLLSGFGLDKHSLTGEYDCFVYFQVRSAECGIEILIFEECEKSTPHLRISATIFPNLGY